MVNNCLILPEREMLYRPLQASATVWGYCGKLVPLQEMSQKLLWVFLRTTAGDQDYTGGYDDSSPPTLIRVDQREVWLKENILIQHFSFT